MPRRRRPAGSETWICVASRCCCRAAYPCSPASNLYAARNTWKVRNVRTLCLITIHSLCSHFHAGGAVAEDAANLARVSRTERERRRGGRRAYFRIRENRAGTHVHLHAYSIGARTFRCVRISIPWHPFQTRARELGCLLGARSFYRKVEILVTILFRDLTRESRRSLSRTYVQLFTVLMKLNRVSLR